MSDAKNPHVESLITSHLNQIGSDPNDEFKRTAVRGRLGKSKLPQIAEVDEEAKRLRRLHKDVKAKSKITGERKRESFLDS